MCVVYTPKTVLSKHQTRYEDMTCHKQDRAFDIPVYILVGKGRGSEIKVEFCKIHFEHIKGNRNVKRRGKVKCHEKVLYICHEGEILKVRLSDAFKSQQDLSLTG